jgi:hypothetical protein
MPWIRRLFWIAGIYGLIVMTPQYFMEQRVGLDYPPAITHPEYFYGFVGVVVAWQIAFLIIGADPARYRLLMIPSVVEKFSFSVAVGILFAQGRVPNIIVGFAAIDLVLGILFLIAFWQSGKSRD